MFTALPAIAVLAVLGVILAVLHHASVVQDRHVETRRLAVAAANNARRLVDDQLAILAAVAASPAVREGDKARIIPYLQTIQRPSRFSAGLGIVDRSGRLVLSSGRLPQRTTDLGMRPYVRAAVQDGRPAVSDVILDARGRPVLAFAYPTSSPAGPRNGAVVGAVRLDELGVALKRLLFANGAQETIVDSRDHVIVGSEPVRGLQAPPDALPLREMRARRVGIIDAVDTPQGKRLVGFSFVQGLPWLVIVDRDHGDVIGPLDHAFWLEIAALAVLALIGLLVTLSVARRLDTLDAERDAALAEQRDIAVRLQRSLLPDVPEPEPLQVHAAYAPAQGAMAVGGDWYDVVELDDGSVALSVGDVAGHGLGAAAAMGQLRSAVRTLALGRASPSDALEQLDRFAARLAGRPLATVVFGIIDPSTGVLRYAVAGHPPPLVVRADGRPAELLDDARSPLLGVADPDDERPEAEVHLGPGDTLVLYTDGLVERPDSSIDAGIEALAARATAFAGRAPEELAGALMDSVPEPRRDDTAVLCVRVGAAQPSSVAS